MKHAWLIIAQNNISQLLKLIKFLDRDCNDIFIHMDKKNKEYSYRLIEETVKCVERHWGRTRAPSKGLFTEQAEILHEKRITTSFVSESCMTLGNWNHEV